LEINNVIFEYMWNGGALWPTVAGSTAAAAAKNIDGFERLQEEHFIERSFQSADCISRSRTPGSPDGRRGYSEIAFPAGISTPKIHQTYRGWNFRGIGKMRPGGWPPVYENAT
jgi:hypothetical protein